MLNVLIPMAGDGKRFADAGYNVPKPLIDMNGKPMIQRAVETLGLPGRYLFAIRRYEQEAWRDNLRSILQQITKDPIILELNVLTQGCACTCLLLQGSINNDDPLVIANCDQVMSWDASKFESFVSKGDFDGCVVTYKKSTPKNSYVKLGDDGYAVEFAEKKVISEHSLNGIHYWRRGSDFVKSTKAMIAKNIRTNNEFYIAPTYNELIPAGKKIVSYEIGMEEHHAVGTPEDLAAYMGRSA
jgi:NDP-sugar pyrophosphorylase family protein